MGKRGEGEGERVEGGKPGGEGGKGDGEGEGEGEERGLHGGYRRGVRWQLPPAPGYMPACLLLPCSSPLCFGC